MPYRLLSGACAEPCSTTIVLIYCLEVKGEIVSNFIFQFVSPSFTGEILFEGLQEGFLTRTLFSCCQPEMKEASDSRCSRTR